MTKKNIEGKVDDKIAVTSSVLNNPILVSSMAPSTFEDGTPGRASFLGNLSTKNHISTSSTGGGLSEARMDHYRHEYLSKLCADDDVIGDNNSKTQKKCHTSPFLHKSYNNVQDTIYLCNFRVSVDGDWLCLRQLDDVEVPMQRPASYYETLPTSPEFIPFYERDPSSVERSNLLNITKLVIKELIEWSIRHGRSLESDHPPLQHFFIVLEHAMRHGLKPKKGLLGPKKELWDVLQLVEKCTAEAHDITSSTRDLPTVNTHLGRARAWLRLALMQKKLADYFKKLIDTRDDLLQEFYEPFALMMSDEAPVLGGLLLGLNVIDCNFCLKEEDLDSQQGVIDFSLYLRSSRSSESLNEEQAINYDSVLDQKNYMEELNRHLNSTVANLQSKVEALTTTNALMKEDVAISKNTITGLQEENLELRQRLKEEERQKQATFPETSLSNMPKYGQNEIESNSTSFGLGSDTVPLGELQKRFQDAIKAKENVEENLQSQIRLKREAESTIKLMEKTLHGKEDLILSLTNQLDDIKIINLEMYKKLQECEEELRDKGHLIDRLQLKTTQIATLLQNLEAAKAFDLPSPRAGMVSSGSCSFQAPFSTASGTARPQNFEMPLPCQVTHNSSLHQLRPSTRKSQTPTEYCGGLLPSPLGMMPKSVLTPIPSFEEIRKKKEEKLREAREDGSSKPQ